MLILALLNVLENLFTAENSIVSHRPIATNWMRLSTSISSDITDNIMMEVSARGLFSTAHRLIQTHMKINNYLRQVKTRSAKITTAPLSSSAFQMKSERSTSRTSHGSGHPTISALSRTRTSWSSRVTPRLGLDAVRSQLHHLKRPYGG